MPSSPEDSDRGRRVHKGILIITVAHGIVPLVVYIVSRLTDSLPSEAAWREYSAGVGNHGPWRYSTWQRPLVYSSIVSLLAVLPAATVLASAVLALFNRGSGVFLKGLAITALQLTIGFTVAWIMYWAID